VQLSVCCFLSNIYFRLSLTLLIQILTRPQTGKPGFIARHMLLEEAVSCIDFIVVVR
jgi:hypothetical protein